MKNIALIFLLFLSSLLIGQSTIVLTDGNLGYSFTKKTTILEDKDHSIYVNEILFNNKKFTPCNHDIEKFQFTSSTFWIKLKITNNSSFQHLIMETGRPITNKVILYEIKNREIINTQKSGDDINFNLKPILHRKSLFQLDIEPSKTKEYLIRFDSDGENIRIPIIIDQNIGFYEKDNIDLFYNGMFYGLLIMVIILYSFFYLGSRDLSLLYYSFYVFSIFLLQFTLDGFSDQFLFGNSLFLKANSIVFFAGTTSIFLLLYVKEYLKFLNQINFWNKVYVISIIILCFITSLTFIKGKTHEISYPLINISSIATLLLIATSISLALVKKIKISKFFITAILTLITGATLYILTNLNILINDFIELYALKIGTTLEVIFLSIAMGKKLRELQVEKEKAQEQSLKNLQEKNKLIDEQKETLEHQVKERTEELEIQKEHVLEKNKEIIDSINYAKRLQDALIPPIEVIKNTTKDLFVLFKPKDIVSGDFYWITEMTTTYNDRPNSKRILLSAADCTGHGVPGAFISIIGLNIFNQTLKEETVNDPAQALDFLNKQIYNTVNKHKESDDIIRDGMDLAICSIDMDTLKLEFAGAKNPIYIVRNNELIEIKGDKQPIGFSENVTPFTLRKFQLEKGDMVYASTDGYADQFGGPRGKKFKYKPFKDLLIEVSQEHPERQKEILEQKFAEWKGDLEQLDDVCVIGIRI